MEYFYSLANQLNLLVQPKDSSGNNHHGVLRKTFSPAAQSGLKLWLDASDSSTVSHTSNAVTHWDDKSGNGNTMSAFDSPSTGTRGHNGKNVIDFDGNDYFQSLNPYASGNDFIS